MKEREEVTDAEQEERHAVFFSRSVSLRKKKKKKRKGMGNGCRINKGR